MKSTYTKNNSYNIKLSCEELQCLTGGKTGTEGPKVTNNAIQWSIGLRRLINRGSGGFTVFPSPRAAYGK